MVHRLLRPITVATLACLCAAGVGRAQETRATSSVADVQAAREADTAEALAVLKRSLNYIGSQNGVRLVMEEGYDAVQVTGQSIENRWFIRGRSIDR